MFGLLIDRLGAGTLFISSALSMGALLSLLLLRKEEPVAVYIGTTIDGDRENSC
jgi:hypothetical protein